MIVLGLQEYRISTADSVPNNLIQKLKLSGKKGTI